MKLNIWIFGISVILSSMCSVQGQDSIKTRPNIGIRLQTYYNYKLLHTSIVLSIHKNNHNIYAGPEYELIFLPINGDPINIYEKNSFGGNFGYRYQFTSSLRPYKVFGQINFSIFGLTYQEFQHGSSLQINKHQVIIENTISVGVEYRIIKRGMIFTGVGFGSLAGFALNFSNFIPTSYIGFEWIF